MPQSASLGKLVAEARHLCDHLLHVEGQDGTELVSALQPIERAESLEKVTDEQVAALSASFQKTYDNALKSVDGYTLNEVLKGRSPHIRRPSIFGSVTLTVIGVMLVIAAFHFSYWSNRTTFILGEAERFIQFDHFQNVMKLVELENYFDQSPAARDTPDLEPQLVYLEGISALQLHYTDELNLPGEMRSRIVDVNPLRGVWDTTKRRVCTAAARSGPEAPRSWLARFMSCPAPVAMRPAATVAVATAQGAAAADALPQSSLFRAKLDEIARLEAETMTAAGRQRFSDYALSQYEVRNMTQRLRDLLNIVHRWALPIIYGSLGSIVYCMWRVLNPNLAPLGLLYSVMRTAFAGLAALTLSMLLIPSNLLSVSTDLNSPVIYLLSFVFGYSIEAFVSTLNGLNTYLSSNLTPKPRRSG